MTIAYLLSGRLRYFFFGSGNTDIIIFAPPPSPTFSLRYRRGGHFQHFCGGALLSSGRHAATAASCLDGLRPEDVFVAAGDVDRVREEPGEMLLAVVRIERHPEYGSVTSTFLGGNGAATSCDFAFFWVNVKCFAFLKATLKLILLYKVMTLPPPVGRTV